MSDADHESFSITGLVFDGRTGRGIKGLRVEAWDKDLVCDDLVGSDETDAEGRFRIEFAGAHYRELFFDRSPDLFFKVFSDGELIESTEESVRWNAGAGATPVEIALQWAGDEAGDGGGYTVTGAVTSPARAGVGGLRVEVVDKNVGRDIPLAETVTDGHGCYRVNFLATPLRARGKTRPDLQARVYAGREFLAASAVRYNAGPQETLNVGLPADTAALPSEYETLLAALAAYYSGRLRDLKESDERQDITYLANKSGWDARAVALAALADQFGQHRLDDAGVPAIKPAFYYSLFRAGLPANPDTLYQAAPQTVERVWRQAIEQGVIPKPLAQEVGPALEAFERLGTQRLLTAPALVGTSSLKEMLDASRLGGAEQERFAELYAAHRADLPAFWQAVGDAFGAATAKRLQVDGRLGLLTINNAPLLQELHGAAGGADGLRDPAELALAGFHRAAPWHQLLNDNVPVPKEIPGDTPEARRANYADYLAAQVRLSYPTAAVAEVVKNVLAADAPEQAPTLGQVHAFLAEHHDRFEIGVEPVEQYVARNNVEVEPETLAQVKSIQRVYQITPTDQALAGLLKHGVDAAYHVVRYEREQFVRTFAEDLGGAEAAAQTYDKSVQVHNAVLNIAVSYLTARNGIGLGALPLSAARQEADGGGQILQPRPQGQALARVGESPMAEGVAESPTAEGVAETPTATSAAHAGDVLAYDTLERLFGEMDFCACDHCRSVLSPAAYLVDLLHFIDRAPTQTNKLNPQTVLLERRPDIAELPLTCENTNTALPYIDVVNETLEYFVTSDQLNPSLRNYAGHDTGGASAEDLLASPQHVIDQAYRILRSNVFPLSLPFHQPLENLRRHFDKFGAPLPLAMERLRRSDALDDNQRLRGPADYGWRDILLEEVGLSRAEYDLLTRSDLTLEQVYGFPAGTQQINAIAILSNAKALSRRLEITYEELAALLKTRFVNPHSGLIPKLERLGVSFATLKALKEQTITDAAFDALLPTGALAPDPAQYGGDIKAWVRRADNYARIMKIITLTDPSGSGDLSSFDDVELRYSEPAADTNDISTRLGAVEFVRLLRLVRLWKKLGWTIEQTDAAICALFPVPPSAAGADALSDMSKLKAGFRSLLPSLGVVVRVMRALRLAVKRDLLSLLACWSPIGTHGDGSLYRQMFLSPTLFKPDPAFRDNGYGEFLAGGTKRLLAHVEALRSAFGLTSDEFGHISADLSFNRNTPLTVENVSRVYRRGWLARKLGLSVRELLLLIRLTGLDPFAPLDLTAPAVLRLAALVHALKERSLKSAAALYLIWNRDLSGRATPDPAQVMEFARTLRDDFIRIEEQFAAANDPGEDAARARLSLVYGAEAAAAFFALLNDTLKLEVPYTHAQPTLEEAIRRTGQRLAYEHNRHRLSHTGLLDAATRDALKQLSGVTPEFQAAVEALFTRGEDARDSFFIRYAELRPLYEDYVSNTVDTPEQKRSALMAAFWPELARRHKRQQALQRFSVAAGTEPDFAQALLDAPGPCCYPLHALGRPTHPAIRDVLALETPGLEASFYFGPAVEADLPADLVFPAVTNLVYTMGSDNPLPATGALLSGVWRGRVEAPDNGFYNFVVEADAGATVSLKLGGRERALARYGQLWRNRDALELRAGVLYEFELTVNGVREMVSIKWETPKRPREAITARYLYPPGLFVPLTAAYVRFLKAASLAQGLGLTGREMAYFAAHGDYQVANAGWLNALAVDGVPAASASPPDAALLKPFQALLDFARIKAEVSPGDESLVTALQDLKTATAQADIRLYAVTRWDQTSVAALLAHFFQGDSDTAPLRKFEQFRRVYDALALTRALGVSAGELLRATTNEPTGDTVRDLQAALRARHDADGWRSVVRPINNALRARQRDALVAHILHGMRSDPASRHIDTADKLFEYFLMDVQMEPCMQTSRVRHAISSVQLFIERCLMNLEPRVSPAAIDGRQWEWMKRYRVWEANRKVFLYPENWLEPELRDDKSPFFKELESELLQSDITEDAAATALLNYLSKLEEVAKLEPCGIYHVEADPNKQTGEVDHVVARTAGANRKYYYRRREFGYWTPWEQIKLDIEDNPVVPVVWQGRLLLFWLRILKQTPVNPNAFNPSSGATGPLTGLTLEAVKTDAKQSAQRNAKVTVQAVLCWSEYYNNKWQPTKTSDVNRPTRLGEYDLAGPDSFDRSVLRFRVWETSEAPMLLITSGQTILDVLSLFLFYNTHSLPVRVEDMDQSKVPQIQWPPKSRAFDGDRKSSFKLWYGDGNTSLTRSILRPDLPFDYVSPDHWLSNTWNAPLIYHDSRHVFFVTTTYRLVPLFSQPDPGLMATTSPVYAERIPPLAVENGSHRAGPRISGDGGPQGPGPRAASAPAQRLVTEDAFIRPADGVNGTVTYDGRLIGPSGSLSGAPGEK